jgi:hypothetical protein
MGSGENKSGFFGSIWMTIVLIVVLIVLGILLIWVLKTGWFYRLGKKKETKPQLRPVMNQQLHNPGERPGLELADNGLIIVTEAELS